MKVSLAYQLAYEASFDMTALSGQYLDPECLKLFLWSCIRGWICNTFPFLTSSFAVKPTQHGPLYLRNTHSISHAGCSSCCVKPTLLDNCLHSQPPDCIALYVLSLHNTPWARASCCGSRSTLQGIPDGSSVVSPSHSQHQCWMHHEIWGGAASVSYHGQCLFSYWSFNTNDLCRIKKDLLDIPLRDHNSSWKKYMSLSRVWAISSLYRKTRRMEEKIEAWIYHWLPLNYSVLTISFH